ncbi:MAG: formimidoylglutamate deiminase [Aliidongia sp.]|nr:formimidoylglutamate deiminase [Aliidongia sp.]
MRALFARTALLPEGWAENVRIDLDSAGDIAAVTINGSPHAARQLAGPVVPGMPNLHSHAFQRAMAGLAERGEGAPGSFWSWREVMYRFANLLGPDEIEAIAAQLYVEMLKAGYTSVCEFHYLHHAPDGSTYADPAELSWRIDAAARRTGIGLTHLPVLYRWGNFAGAPPDDGQRRFLCTPDMLLEITAMLAKAWQSDPERRIGIAPHSLRAVAPDDLTVLLDGFAEIDATAPIHIHVAEQIREVEDCLTWSGRRPAAWLLDHAPVDRRWCLIHSTHTDADELASIAARGAVAGLCPSTEGNLGDGVFGLTEFQAAGGRWGIGTDSHISINPVEELRWLEYGQRLAHQRRNLASAPGQSTGAALWRRALEGGAQAAGRKIGRLEAGARADLLVLDGEHPLLAGKTGDRILDALVFAGNAALVRDAMVGGIWRVEDRRHAQEREIALAYKRVVRSLH